MERYTENRLLAFILKQPVWKVKISGNR